MLTKNIRKFLSVRVLASMSLKMNSKRSIPLSVLLSEISLNLSIIYLLHMLVRLAFLKVPFTTTLKLAFLNVPTLTSLEGLDLRKEREKQGKMR